MVVKNIVIEIQTNKNIYFLTYLVYISVRLEFHRFHISVRCDMDSIGLFLKVLRVAKSEMINYEFSARRNLGEQFLVKHSSSTMTSQGDSDECMDFMELSLGSFLSEDSEYFIDDVLYLRVDVSIESMSQELYLIRGRGM